MYGLAQKLAGAAAQVTNQHAEQHDLILIRSGTMTEDTKPQAVRRLDELSSQNLHSEEKGCTTSMVA